MNGAKWWQYHAHGATAFPSERESMEDEAVRRYGEPAPVPLPEEQLPKEGVAVAPTLLVKALFEVDEPEPETGPDPDHGMDDAAPAFNERLRKAGLGGLVAGTLGEEDYPTAAPAPGDAAGGVLSPGAAGVCDVCHRFMSWSAGRCGRADCYAFGYAHATQEMEHLHDAFIEMIGADCDGEADWEDLLKRAADIRTRASDATSAGGGDR